MCVYIYTHICVCVYIYTHMCVCVCRKGGDSGTGLGDTGAAILQKACELSSSITENVL